ncbi:phage minor capsid protein [Siminovitchia sp. FSL W7-1587]|uniref:minor capsid protein n=1 Tax=Siminovitchia sp. FSL W7-1587 TaxID=2954699 RepID=UPI0030CC43E9
MSSYWRKRELDHIRKQIKNDAVIARRIRQKYMEAMNEIQTQIEAFYGRYADAEGITMEEARKRVSKVDIEEYKEKAERYVRDKEFSKRANEEMRLYNVTMKINRLQLLKLNIELELLAAVSDEERILYEELTKMAWEEFKRQSAILGESLNYNEKNIKSIVNSSFLNATWSDRLWDNQDALRSQLDRLLNKGVIQGKNPRELARDLRKTFDTSISNSERLLRTEMARVQQDVFQDSMEQADFDAYEFIAEPKACPTCKKIDGEIFKLSDAQPGVNAYPMHPNCRCSQAAAMDRAEWDRKLRERGL